MMEVTPHLKSVLKNYQHSATKSLQGPGGLSLKAEPLSEDEYVPATAFPVQALLPPILTTPDTSCAERTETSLEGEAISCFVVGGERRLCLPQVLNSVLRDFELHQINAECDQLQIYCSRCTPEQLNVLKSAGILPSGAASSGLITKTDAERLCSALMPVRPPPRALKGAAAFGVHHRCFGRARGLCRPELYTSKTAKCIECRDCQGGFAPHQFVTHVHRDAFSENRTVHWGFDSGNWRAYLKVEKDEPERERCDKLLDEMQGQFEGRIAFARPVNIYAGIKRKQVLAADALKEHPLPLKKQKLAEYLSPLVPLHLYGVYMQQYNMLADMQVANRHLSAFKPVKPPPPTTTPAPPLLQHPERVVTSSESERFERTFQPNVALAPPTPKKHRYGRTAFIKAEAAADVKPEPVAVKEEPVASVSVVVQRYNPDIELSTDTEDSAGEVSERAHADLGRVEEWLRGAEEGVRERVLEAFRGMAKEKERWVRECRAKEEAIRALEERLAAAAPPAKGASNGVGQTSVIASAATAGVEPKAIINTAPE